jgi:RNA polymerase sigma-70 factor (ECF subfamily)
MERNVSALSVADIRNETAGTSQTTPAIHPEKWVEAYGDALYRYAFAHCKDKFLTEDLTQAPFIAALKTSQGFQYKSKELPWFTGILR